MYVGEGRLAWSEERTGQRVPRVSEAIFNDLPSNPVAFAELVGTPRDKTGEDAFRNAALAYVLFFRAGPAKYRKAYESFRAELATTRNERRATEAHLLSLDQEKMRQDLARWLRRSVQGIEDK
jgi:hypothetical protein